MQCVYLVRVKKTLFFHILYLLLLLYAPSFWNVPILQSSSFWEARCALIGQLSGVLWLAEYLKRVTEMYAPYCIVMPCPGAMRQGTIKTHYKEAFVAFSEEIITNYINLYVFLRVEPRIVLPCLHLWS